MAQTITLIINELPYKNDKGWNALRLADKLISQKCKVNIFLLENGVDVGKENQKSQGKNYNLEKMVKDLLAKNVSFLACRTCLKTCGISKEKLIKGIREGRMDDLAKWVQESDKVLVL